MGSAVDEAEITRQLQLFQAAGIGGVEISPIYGVTGEQTRFIPFLSPGWIDMLRHTVRQARRLGMDVDLLCGTGWPLGGPWVRAEDAPPESCSNPTSLLRATMTSRHSADVTRTHPSGHSRLHSAQPGLVM